MLTLTSTLTDFSTTRSYNSVKRFEGERQALQKCTADNGSETARGVPGGSFYLCGLGSHATYDAPFTLKGKVSNLRLKSPQGLEAFKSCWLTGI
jgi:hypothetical protein